MSRTGPYKAAPKLECELARTGQVSLTDWPNRATVITAGLGYYEAYTDSPPFVYGRPSGTLQGALDNLEAAVRHAEAQRQASSNATCDNAHEKVSMVLTKVKIGRVATVALPRGASGGNGKDKEMTWVVNLGAVRERLEELTDEDLRDLWAITRLSPSTGPKNPLTPERVDAMSAHAPAHRQKLVEDILSHENLGEKLKEALMFWQVPDA